MTLFRRNQNASLNTFRNSVVAQGCGVSRSHRVSEGHCLACLKARLAVKDAGLRGLNGTGGTRDTPTVGHVWLRCVILCLCWEKVNSHSLSSDGHDG